MSTSPVALDFSKAQPLPPEQPVALDFSKAQPIDTPPVDNTYKGAAAGATSLSADTRGPFRRAWDEIKGGLTAAQPGEGLKPQPTALGNAAEFVGMAGSTAAGLMGPEEGASAAEKISNALPTTSTKGAVQGFKELQGAIGNHTVAMTDRLANSLADIKDAVDTGSTLPPVINKFVTRIADLDEGPLTYKEARQFYSNVSQLSASERMAAKPNDLRLIQEFKHALGETVSDTAANAGRLQQYQGAMSDFANAKQWQGRFEAMSDVAKKAVIRSIEGALAGGGGYGAYRVLKDLFGSGQ